MADAHEIRVGDADRHAVIEVLRRATGEGRLTLDEFAERAEQVYAARTRDELAALTRDLPHEGTPAAAGGGPAQPGATAGVAGSAGVAPVASQGAADERRPRRRRFVAIMGGSRPRGRWRPSEKIDAFAFWGEVRVDMRDAIIDTPVIEITAWAIMGSVTVVVPEGIPVELDGFVLMGSARDRSRSAGAIAGAPLVRVRARGFWGSVAARNPSPRSPGPSDGHGIHGRPHHGRHGGPPVAGPPPAPAPPPPAPAPPAPPDPAGLPGPSEGGRIPPLGQEREGVRVAGHRGAGQGRETSAPGGEPRATRAAPPGGAVAAGGARRDAQGGPTVPGDSGASGSAGAGVEIEPHGGTLTVMVTDIAASTEMAERLGDQRWLGVLQTHNAIVREQVQRYRGTEVKSQGDGFLVTFTSARRAVLSAIAIQRAMARYRRAHPEHQVRLRIGLHTGEVTLEDGDVLGQNVVVAVRIAGAAQPGEILVSALTKDLTDAGGDLGFGDGREADLKGLARRWQVHPVAWE